MKVTELFEQIDTTKAKEWVNKMYDEYHANPLNPRQRVLVWGTGDDQQLGIFELKPRLDVKDAVEIQWFQAYPLRQGVGTKAMKELQDEAKKAGIKLTLFPWDKGRISQANLIKFYKKMGFKMVNKGGKDMMWEPPADLEDTSK